MAAMPRQSLQRQNVSQDHNYPFHDSNPQPGLQCRRHNNHNGPLLSRKRSRCQVLHKSYPIQTSIMINSRYCFSSRSIKHHWFLLTILLQILYSHTNNTIRNRSTFLFVKASRAYPHGCMYRHPSYYTYDERDDISWADAISTNDGFDTGHIGSPTGDHQMIMGHTADSFYATENTNYLGMTGDGTDGGGSRGMLNTGYGMDVVGVNANENLGSISDAGGARRTNHIGRNSFGGASGASINLNRTPSSSSSSIPYTDFRFLPSQSSHLRRPYDRYRLTRRLGAGKFSDVFEAVDVVWEESRKREIRRRRRRRRRKTRLGSREFGNYRNEGDTTEDETTEGEGDEWGKDDDVDVKSLVVLKCLKPISERKIRRELLVLTHCATLPNLARFVGIVLPDSMDKESSEQNEANSLEQSQEQQTQRRRTTTNGQKQEGEKTKTNGHLSKISTSTVKISSNNSHDKNNIPDGKQLPALVLEHAGQHSQWFCHGPRPSINPTAQQHHLNNELEEHDSDYLSEHEMKYYLCHLLIALDGLHAAGIMHRDVKPRNCLINHFSYPDWNRKHRSSNASEIEKESSSSPSSISQQIPQPLPPPPLMLVDLGLADFYLPGKDYNVRVASRHYKSPELLIGYEYYDYAIDMWSVGCMLAGLLFRREPFFRGKDNEDQLGKIVSVLGTRDFLPYCRKCNVSLSSKARAAIGKYCSSSMSSSSAPSSEDAPALDRDVGQRAPWLSFLSPKCPIPSPDALDLLDRLLVYDHEQRWTAREALGHSFFDEVREEVWREVQERILWESQWRPLLMQSR